MNTDDTNNFSAHEDFRIGHQGVGRQFSSGQISWHNLNKKVKENAKLNKSQDESEQAAIVRHFVKSLNDDCGSNQLVLKSLLD